MDCGGNPISEETNNLITNTRLYEVKCIYGTIETLAVNVIAKNILLQVNKERHIQLLMDKIINHRKNKDAIEEYDTFYTTSNGDRGHRQNTKVWELYVQWKYVSSNWIYLKNLKNSYSLEVADYAVTNTI